MTRASPAHPPATRRGVGRAAGAPLRVVVSANFTAEPLRAVLSHWLRTLSIDATVSFAPYNQIMPMLLDPASPVSLNADGVNVLLLRHDVFRQPAEDRAFEREPGTDVSDDPHTRAAAATDHFVRALDARARATGGVWIVACCPPAPAHERPDGAGFWDALDRRVAQGLDDTPGTMVIRAADTLRKYPVRDYFDEPGHRLADLPYTSVFFGALATMVARAIHVMLTPPRKVIVLDCDNTLWSGICGEEGAAGVAIDGPRRVLQQFVVGQMQAGALLCLCSKNEERDVWRVFDEHPDMILRREHIVAWRINWTAKADNIRALAEELGLDVRTFIFVDDDPVECAEVEARLAGVLTVQLPSLPGEIPALLEHVWAFDRPRPTDADRSRTHQYALQRQRDRSRADAPTNEDFVRTLDVRVRIAGARPADLTRIAQLTHRTTQFNCTLRRRTEAELRRAHQQHEHVIFAVHASDRFGDYGLVGTIIGTVRDRELDVDTFLLSCRALGRNIEHRMLHEVEEAARQRGLAAVRLPFVRGERNQIAKAFLDSCRPAWVPEGDDTSPEYVRVWSPSACGGSAAGVA